MVICPDCGKEVPKAKFCKNCGAYIENVEEQPVNVPVTIKPDDVEETVPAESGMDEIPVSIKSGGDAVEVIPVESGEDEIPLRSNSAREVKYCFNCGYELGSNFHFCPKCGQDLWRNVQNKNTNHVSTAEKSTLLAVILSVFLPGLGQIYLGLDHKGAIFLIGYVISAILILLLIGFILCPVIWIWALVDTIMSANAINRGEEVNDKLL